MEGFGFEKAAKAGVKGDAEKRAIGNWSVKEQ